MNLNPTSPEFFGPDFLGPEAGEIRGQAIVLLSGGLDSTVALAETLQHYKVPFTLTFNYGQRALERELKASEAISRHYGLPHRVISLPWLAELLPQVMASQSDASDTDWNLKPFETAHVWIPNRNALFLSIAASLAEAHEVQTVVFGANAEEGENFPDNTPAFRQKLTDVFALSTLNHVQVLAPVEHLRKKEIIQRGLALQVPLQLIWSCYEGAAQQCGQCPSCTLLKQALREADQELTPWFKPEG